MAGGEVTISTIGYIAKCRGTDCQMNDIWCIILESLTVLVHGQQYIIVVRCIRRYQCRSSNRLDHSDTKESHEFVVISS